MVLADDRSARLVRGGAAGIIAFVLGYLVTYAWKAPAVEEALGGVNAIAELLGGQAVPTWKAVGWLHLNAHLVATRVPALGGGDRLVNLIDASDDGSLVLLYLLVPALLLLAGAALARYDRAGGFSAGARAGAATLVGYLPAAAALTLASPHVFGGGVSVAPAPVTGLALAGIVYPALLGAVGGGLWGSLAPTPADRSR